MSFGPRTWFAVAVAALLLAVQGEAAGGPPLPQGEPTAGYDAAVVRRNCTECHRRAEALLGPSFEDMAQFYADRPADDDLVQRLADKIVHGGYGTWGLVPMVAHEEIPAEEARAMVRWILSLTSSAER